VLRLGRYVGTFDAATVDHEEIVGYMTGAFGADRAGAAATSAAGSAATTEPNA
jgi:ABC-type sugar transport system ATPase subunit